MYAQKSVSSLIKERDALLRGCVRAGASFCGGDLSKIYSGKLSPGCRICADGRFSSLFITDRCTRKCSFCSEDRSEAAVREYKAKEVMNGMEFLSARAYIAHMRGFGYKGSGIVGGDPFLEFERMAEYARKIKGGAGPGTRVWAYTNGDLVTAGKLKALAAAGLDELRFNICPSGYDLGPARLAAGYIKTVTVEIPAVPEDEARLEALLPEMRRAGVKYLNLHQLHCTPHNREAFRRAGYTLVRAACDELPGVLESELAALRILKASLRPGTGLPVHYCSRLYKERHFPAYSRGRLAQFLSGSRPFDPAAGTPTETGAMRRVWLKAGGGGAAAVLRLAGGRLKGGVRRARGKICLDPRLLALPELAAAPVAAEYYHYRLACGGVFSPARLAALSVPGAPGISEEAMGEVALPGRFEKELFVRLFLGGRSSAAPRGRAAAFRKKFEGLEFLPGGLPEYL